MTVMIMMMIIMAIMLVVMVIMVVSGAFYETNIRDIAEEDPSSGFSVVANILKDYRFEFLGSPVGWELICSGERET